MNEPVEKISFDDLRDFIDNAFQKKAQYQIVLTRAEVQFLIRMADKGIEASKDKVCETCDEWRRVDRICGHCLNDSMMADGRKNAYPQKNGITIIDKELYTGPEFGCVHWEGKG